MCIYLHDWLAALYTQQALGTAHCHYDTERRAVSLQQLHGSIYVNWPKITNNTPYQYIAAQGINYAISAVCLILSLPSKKEVNAFARVCLSVCLVCLSVSKITQKIVHGFG